MILHIVVGFSRAPAPLHPIHALGTPTETDRYELGKDFPKIAEIDLRIDRASGRVLCTVQDGDGGEFSHDLRTRKGEWKRFSVFGDRTDGQAMEQVGAAHDADQPAVAHDRHPLDAALLEQGSDLVQRRVLVDAHH